MANIYQLPKKSVVVDAEITETSFNPVQSNVLYTALAGKADAAHTQAASSITGLAAVATTGNYSDLSGTPAAYQPEPATTSTRGVVIVDNTLNSLSVNPVQNSIIVTALAGKAATTHQHVASDTTSGIFDITLLPTGTTASSLSLGNHTHTLSQMTDVQVSPLSTGEILQYDGSKWINVPAPTNGVNGANGTNGVNVLLQANNETEFIQWKQDNGTDNWHNLVSYGAITGPAGETGDPGDPGDPGTEVRFRVTTENSESVVQWGYVGGNDWTTLFSLDALKGDPGDPGTAGTAGATPNITIGTVETVSATSNAAATITGATPNLILNLQLPRGAAGDNGEAGAPGAPGEDGSAVSMRFNNGSVQYSIDETNWTTLCSFDTNTGLSINGNAIALDRGVGHNQVPYGDHTHDAYSLTTHNHDSRYALVAHTHTGAYSPIAHGHSLSVANISNNGSTTGVVISAGESGVAEIVDTNTVTAVVNSSGQIELTATGSGSTGTTYTAGTGINISASNVISANYGTSTTPGIVKAGSGVTIDAYGALSVNDASGTGTTYSSGTGIDITGTIISVITGTTANTVSAGNHTHSTATAGAAGFLSSTDKTKLDGIPDLPTNTSTYPAYSVMKKQDSATGWGWELDPGFTIEPIRRSNATSSEGGGVKLTYNNQSNTIWFEDAYAVEGVTTASDTNTNAVIGDVLVCIADPTSTAGVTAGDCSADPNGMYNGSVPAGTPDYASGCYTAADVAALNLATYADPAAGFTSDSFSPAKMACYSLHANAAFDAVRAKYAVAAATASDAYHSTYSDYCTNYTNITNLEHTTESDHAASADTATHATKADYAGRYEPPTTTGSVVYTNAFCKKSYASLSGIDRISAGKVNSGVWFCQVTFIASCNNAPKAVKWFITGSGNSISDITVAYQYGFSTTPNNVNFSGLLSVSGTTYLMMIGTDQLVTALNVASGSNITDCYVTLDHYGYY